jgi:ammonium transporter, Amt family
MKKLFASLGLMAFLLAPGLGLAQEAVEPVVEAASEVVEAVDAMVTPEAAPVEEAAAAEPVPDKGDTTWMMLSTIIVIMMTIPGLALFYGGLVRAKNMLSVLTQVMAIFALISILWVVYGYSLAFGDGGGLNWMIGDLSKMFLAGITADSTAATFSDGVVIPEFIFVAFQLTFAAITVALITRRPGRAGEVFRPAGVRCAVVHLLLPADHAHGVGNRRLPVRSGRPRLRGRHGGAHQRRYCRAGWRAGAGQAYRLRP